MNKLDVDSEELIRRRLRYLIQTQYNGVAAFHAHLYGSRANEALLQSFNWFLNKGDMNWEFMRLLCEKTQIGQIPLGRLLDMNINNETLFAD